MADGTKGKYYNAQGQLVDDVSWTNYVKQAKQRYDEACTKVDNEVETWLSHEQGRLISEKDGLVKAGTFESNQRISDIEKQLKDLEKQAEQKKADGKKKCAASFRKNMSYAKGKVSDDDIKADKELQAIYDSPELKAKDEQNAEDEQTAEGEKKTTDGSSSTTTTTTTTKKGQEQNTAEGTAEIAGSGIAEGVFSSIAKWAKDKNGMGKDGDPMGRDARLNRQAQMHDNEAAEHRMDQQRWSQIANQDPRREAGKDALAKADVENQQKVNNMGNASAGAAALERGEAEADPNVHRNRADQARTVATQNMEKANDENQVAEQERSAADVYGYTARDMNVTNSKAKSITSGGIADQEGETSEEEVVPKKTKTEDDTPAKSGEQSWQRYITMLCYKNDTSSRHNENSPNYNAQEEALANPLYERFKKQGVKPLTPEEVAKFYDGNTTAMNVLFPNGQAGTAYASWDKGSSNATKQLGYLQDVLEKKYPKMMSAWRDENPNRYKNGNQINGKEGSFNNDVTEVETKEKDNTDSDRNMKDIKAKKYCSSTVAETISAIPQGF